MLLIGEQSTGDKLSKDQLTIQKICEAGKVKIEMQ